jgi:hypothetical protein
MLRPLGLPPGSVRALLLLALAARAIFDLRHGGEIVGWLAVALIVGAASYFSARASGTRGGAVGDGRPPLGLPAGTVRTAFLLAVAYGSWLWLADREITSANMPIAMVLGGFVLGVVARWILSKARRPDDAGTPLFYHVQALVALVSAGGLVAIALAGRSEAVPAWTEPLLATALVYYFGAR